MTSRQTAASKGFNSHHIADGIVADFADSDGDIWRGAIVTNVGESTENELDLCADGETPLGVVVDFPDGYEIDIDTANSTAGYVIHTLLRGTGGLCYTYQDAAAEDALLQGSPVEVAGVDGYASLATDFLVDNLGQCQEVLTCVTTSYYAFKVLI